MFRTGVARELKARHYLEGDFGDESVPHAHPYRVEVRCETEDLDAQGFSVNIALLEELLKDELEAIDDKLLNDLPFFADRRPSLENLALFLWEQLNRGLEKGLAESEKGPDRIEIRIWESDSAWAAYSADR